MSLGTYSGVVKEDRDESDPCVQKKQGGAHKENFKEDLAQKGQHGKAAGLDRIRLPGNGAVQNIPFEKLQDNGGKAAEKRTNQSPGQRGAVLSFLSFHHVLLCIQAIEGCGGFSFYRLEGDSAFHHLKAPSGFPEADRPQEILLLS